jgi:hypothetical protein
MNKLSSLPNEKCMNSASLRPAFVSQNLDFFALPSSGQALVQDAMCIPRFDNDSTKTHVARPIFSELRLALIAVLPRT